MKYLNLLVRFLLELSMLTVVGYWGFKTHSSWLLKILFGIGLPALIALLWGLFIAPKAIYPLSNAPRLILEMVLFASASIALFASANPALGWAYTIILITNKVLQISWKQ